MPDKDLKSLVHSHTPDEEFMGLLNFQSAIELSSLDLSYTQINQITEDDQGNNTRVVLEAIEGGKFNSNSSPVTVAFRRVPLNLVFNSVKEVIYPDVPFLPGKDPVEEIKRIYGVSLFSEYIEAESFNVDTSFDKEVEIRATHNHPTCIGVERILIKIIYPDDPVSIKDIFKTTVSTGFEEAEPFLFTDLRAAEPLTRHPINPNKLNKTNQPRLSLSSLFKGDLK